MKLKKGDKVKILLGKDRGKTGSIDQVFAKKGTVLVAGLNLYKKHTKPRGENDKAGGIISQSRPLAGTKVALICPKCAKITRPLYAGTAEGKVRICRRCRAQI
ncbi:MAG TPA: 50S ribosomal protein L24 [Patescibacteria group bacterium]|nr:50S ribosomal protein L24 [Patescibacteria group bacterium]